MKNPLRITANVNVDKDNNSYSSSSKDSTLMRPLHKISHPLPNLNSTISEIVPQHIDSTIGPSSYPRHFGLVQSFSTTMKSTICGTKSALFSTETIGMDETNVHIVVDVEADEITTNRGMDVDSDVSVRHKIQLEQIQEAFPFGLRSPLRQVFENFMEIIPGLPEDLGIECLIRSHYATYRAVSQTCQAWRKLLNTPGFHQYRKHKGYADKLACLVQSLPAKVLADEARKPVTSPSYGITIFDSSSRTWERLIQVPKYVNGLPLFCQVSSSEGKLILMGGWDPVTYAPVKNVFVYDFVKQLWRQGKDMPSKRAFFAMGAIGGQVYVAGGHDENKNALKSAWVYDMRRDKWSELMEMAKERDECEGVVIGNEFWVVSGYDTNSQGVFGTSAESYSVTSGTWKLVDSMWKAGECPRVSVMRDKNGKMVRYNELDLSVPSRAYGTELGGHILLTRSAYGGVKNDAFLLDVNDGKQCKIEKLDVPEEFCGVVQSGCCVEI